jgi:hypothetical protein
VSSLDGLEPLFCERLRGVAESRENVFLREVVLFRDLTNREATCELRGDEVDGDTRALDHRLPEAYRLIGRDPRCDFPREEVRDAFKVITDA